MSVVRVVDLTVRFGPTVALDDVTFDLEAGTTTALVGSNGSGKTTLLKALAGLGPVNDIERPETVAYVGQHAGSDRWLPVTVGEVIQMGCYRLTGPFGRLTAELRASVGEAAERMDVDDLMNRQFGDLSGGQRQRVLVAQALVQQAPLLLLDEPITGLDIPSQHRILDVVSDEATSGVCVVLSTHHLDEASACDSVILLANRLVAQGPPAEVLTAELLRGAFGLRVLDLGDDVALIDDHGHGSHGGH